VPARLATTQVDLKDASKSQILGQERDEALRVTRGGSALQRAVRATKWFVIGAATGAIAIADSGRFGQVSGFKT
jgi:hypothetical protein